MAVSRLTMDSRTKRVVVDHHGREARGGAWTSRETGSFHERCHRFLHLWCLSRVVARTMTWNHTASDLYLGRVPRWLKRYRFRIAPSGALIVEPSRGAGQPLRACHLGMPSEPGCACRVHSSRGCESPAEGHLLTAPFGGNPADPESSAAWVPMENLGAGLSGAVTCGGSRACNALEATSSSCHLGVHRADHPHVGAGRRLCLPPTPRALRPAACPPAARSSPCAAAPL